jgi:3-isopropylmalate/(R)-2-methylmalate dehydratase large subunit
MTAQPQTLLDKLWSQHVVKRLSTAEDLIHVDRFFLHDLSGLIAIPDLRRRGLTMRSPSLNFAVTDHAVSTARGREHHVDAKSRRYVFEMRDLMREAGIRHFDIGDDDQGIVHVIGPELGLTLPGTTVLCTDSHTCTHGALGALAWGVGQTDALHILATQTIVQAKPKAMRIRLDGTLPRHVSAKDVILAVIGRFGAATGVGYAVEFCGSAVQAMLLEGRLTLCNMAVELGSRTGIIAPDIVTADYLHGRPYVPAGALWDAAVKAWHDLRSDDDATFDRDLSVDVTHLRPQVTWGTSVDQVQPIDGRVPDPDAATEVTARNAIRDALRYMDLRPHQALEGVPVQHVFIGSCTNGRISDLKIAADIVRGRKVAPGVRAWVVPGSSAVKRTAEREGLDRIFRDAGFDWRESGCSMCSAVNGDIVAPGERSISTTNRNFVGRQGPGSRTHLANPAVAAASALTGTITDPRKVLS